MIPGETITQRNQRLFECAEPVAFITGSAAARVGRRIAEHLMHQGFRLVLHAHRPSSAAQELVESWQAQGRQVHLVTGGVENEETVRGWVTELQTRFQRVDLLVNSAAIWDPKPLEQTSADDMRRFFEVNALGTALTSQQMGLMMVEQSSGGAIINIGDWAVRRPYRDFSAYFPSKGAVETITQAMAIELASRNPRIRVNAVLPGPVMLAEEVSETRRQRLVSDCLLQRAGTADDVAWAVTFLATSPFITGVCLPVDGGRTIYAGPTADSIAHPSVDDGSSTSG